MVAGKAGVELLRCCPPTLSPRFLLYPSIVLKRLGFPPYPSLK